MLPLKILFVSHSSDLDGAERCLLDVVCNIDPVRFAPTVICPTPGPLADELRDLGVPTEVLDLPFMGQRFSEVLGFAFGVAPGVQELARYVKQDKFSLIYNNSLQNPYGAMAARFASVPCLWHIHELVRHPLLRLVLTYGASTLGTRLVLISRAVKATFPSERPGKVNYLIPNGIDPADFNPHSFDRRAVRDLYNIPRSQPVLLVVGRLHPRKGHDILLNAMPVILQRWPDCLLLVAGSGPQLRFLTDLTGEMQIESNVRFLGYESDVRPLYAAADVLVLPSRFEPFGRVLIEAMSMEKPVVAVKEGGPLDVVTPDTGVLVRGGDAGELAAAIVGVLENPERANEMGKRGRERVLSYFSLSAYVSAIEQAMIETIDAHSGRLTSASRRPG